MGIVAPIDGRFRRWIPAQPEACGCSPSHTHRTDDGRLVEEIRNFALQETVQQFCTGRGSDPASRSYVINLVAIGTVGRHYLS
jgi:hypothetical protein